MVNIYKLPSAVVSSIFSFMELRENIDLSTTSRWMKSVSLLPSSSPVKLILRTPERKTKTDPASRLPREYYASINDDEEEDECKFAAMPNLARFRPQKLSCVGNSDNDLLTKQILNALTFYGHFGHQSSLRSLSLQLDNNKQKSVKRVWRTLEMIGDCTRLVDYAGSPLLERLELEWSNYQAYDASKTLKKLTSIKTIVLRGVTLPIISHLPPSVTDLTVVESGYSDFDDSDITPALCALPQLRRLAFYAITSLDSSDEKSRLKNSIYLEGYKSTTNGQSNSKFKQASRKPQMVEMFDVGDALAQQIADGAPNLEELCCITFNLTKPMPKIGRLRKLSVLFARPEQLEFATRNNGAELTTLRSESNYRVSPITISSCYCRFVERKDFAFLANCPQLQRLILRHLKITDESVRGIKDYTSASTTTTNYLTHLDLSGNHLTQLPVPLHEILKYPDQLISLRIANNRFRTIDPSELSTDIQDSTTCLQSAKQLRHLDTSGVLNVADWFSLADHYPSLESWRPAVVFVSNFLSSSSQPIDYSQLANFSRLDLTRMEEKEVENFSIFANLPKLSEIIVPCQDGSSMNVCQSRKFVESSKSSQRVDIDNDNLFQLAQKKLRV